MTDSLWRVRQGHETHWFLSEKDAKQFSKDRWDDFELDGVPFIDQISLSEVVITLNVLETVAIDMKKILVN